MTMLRALMTLVLSALLVLGCRPAPLGVPPIASVGQPLLQGSLLLSDDFAVQATANQVRANATVTLIDPATHQAKGTGITAADGKFTIQALGSFTPTLGTLYMLESTKTLGGVGNPIFRLRTLVRLDAGGWTSISGSTIQLSSVTTAVSLFWQHFGLGAADLIGKVSYDAPSQTHRFGDLNATFPELSVREAHHLVNEALLLNFDPIQVVRPSAKGGFQLTLAPQSGNMVADPGFEEQATTLPYWWLNDGGGQATFAIGAPYESRRSVALTANGAGDIWFGHGVTEGPTGTGIRLEAGKTYTFSIYAKGAAGGEKIALAMNYRTPFLEVKGNSETLTNQWARYTWTFTSAYTTSRAILLVRFGDRVGQAIFPASLFVDAVQFEEGGVAQPYSPREQLTMEGFGNALERVNVTPVAGRSGRAVLVDNGVNVLPNSSFETDTDANGLPDGMYRTATVSSTYALDSSVALFHGKSLKVVSPAPADDHVYFGLTYPFKAGKTYTFSYWVKGEGVSGAPDYSAFGLHVHGILAANPVGAASAEGANSAAGPVGTFDWTRVSVSMTFKNDCQSARVYPLFRNKTGTVWIDGFQVEENPVATPYAGEGPDRLTFPAYPAFTRHQGTLSFWYMPTYGWVDDRGNGQLATLCNPYGNTLMAIFKDRKADGMGTLALSVWDGAASQTTEWKPATPAWLPGTWHHLAVTWGARGLELYADGERIATSGYKGPLGGSSEAYAMLLFAGKTGGNAVTYANGGLDGLRVWNVQRTPERIRREYLGLD